MYTAWPEWASTLGMFFGLTQTRHLQHSSVVMRQQTSSDGHVMLGADARALLRRARSGRIDCDLI